MTTVIEQPQEDEGAIQTTFLAPISKKKRGHGKERLSPLIGAIGEMVVEIDLKSRDWYAIRVQESLTDFDIFAVNSERRIEYRIEVTTSRNSRNAKLRGEKLFDVLAYVKNQNEIEYCWNDGTAFDPDFIFGEPFLLEYLNGN